MSTQLRAIALFVACCTASVSARAQEDLTVPPLPPIESELFEQTPEVDYARQDVAQTGETPVRYDNSWLEFLSKSRIIWDSDITVFDTEWGAHDGSDTFVAMRDELSWERQSGWGLRLGYNFLTPTWEVHHTQGTEIVNPAPGDIANYAPYYAGAILTQRDVDNINFDLYKRIDINQAEILLGVGLTRVRSIEELQQIFDTGGPGGTYSYINSCQSLKGVGLGLSGRLRQPVFRRGTWEVAFMLNGRTSFVPIDVEQQSQLFAFTSDHDMKLHEGRIGLEVLKRFETVTGVAGCHYETQHWDNDTTDVRSFDGVAISLGLQW
jgi:hypothetical protein